MKLRKLEILGFKSFTEKTVIKFDHDVTGIVGPNGCGKSNIVDAIRWCMGEQSAKHLRGKSMEDVIFNGSETRGPAGMAEVTLTFDNQDGLTPVEYRDYPEIAVTRRLYRDGDSEYLINKTQVRLKDITDLFLGTGAGTKAYSIIEQGKVGLIVTSKPEDRRLLIEEAAGITKYKSKRKQAERKMELTHQNLLRVADSIAEQEKNLTSLKRQAQKADRYLSYRTELDDLTLHEAAFRYLSNMVTTQYFAGALAETTDRASQTKSALVTREAELETMRLRALESERRLETATSDSFQTDNLVRALEGEIARASDQLKSLQRREGDATRDLDVVMRERDALASEEGKFRVDLESHRLEEETAIEALAAEEDRLHEANTRQADMDRKVQELGRRSADSGARIARAETSLKGFERRRGELQQRREKHHAEREDLQYRQHEQRARVGELRRQVDDLRAGKTTHRQARESAEESLGTYRVELVEVDKRLDHEKHELSRSRSRLHALTEVQSRLEGVGQGVRSLIQRRDPRVLGMVADFVEPLPEATQALASFLGDQLQTLIVEERSTALELAGWLRDEKKGRATFLPRDGKCLAPGLAVLPGDGVYLADQVSVRGSDEDLVRRLLGTAVVVDDLKMASDVMYQAPWVCAVVTRAGEVLHADGRIAAGAREQLLSGMLESKRETRELADVVSRLDGVVGELVGRQQQLRSSLQDTQTALEAARQNEHKGELLLVTVEKDLRSGEGELERSQGRLELLAGELAELGEQLAESDEEQALAKDELEGANLEKSSVDRDIDEARAVADERRAELDARRQVVTERKVQAARSKERTRNLQMALERLTRSGEELAERRRRLSDELYQGAIKQGEHAGFVVQHRDLLTSAVVAAKEAREAQVVARMLHEEARLAMGAHEAELKSLRQNAEVAEKERVGHDMRVRELAIERRSLVESIGEKFRGLDLPRIIGDYHLRDIPGAEHKARMKELDGLIERLGPVNLEAKREHDECAARFAHYIAQKADLDKALSDLAKAIEQMDRESRRLFKETFDAVNERFQQLFPVMFRGGRASLAMTNPDDLLETGIEILAQPPGKKIGNIELMSGGEKALTAVSLIFAMFQIRPSPFCILDEVDAPLDEANVARYNEAVRTMTDRSQFILITHIKRTMQMVDVLYGVTMPEPGVSALTSVDLTTIDKKRGAEPLRRANFAVA